MHSGAIQFKSWEDQQWAENLTKKVKEKLAEASEYIDKGEDGKAKKIWRKVFGAEFKIGDIEEAKALSEALSAGALKYSGAIGLSLTKGNPVPKSSGFFGSERDQDV